MTLFFNTLNEMYLGYVAIYICMGAGFLFLRKVNKDEIGPGYWALSFFLNSIGFIFWSGFVPLLPWQYFLIGEVAHVLGFFMLAWGAYRFAGYTYKIWNAIAVLTWVVIWALAIVSGKRFTLASMYTLKFLRVILFIAIGILMLARKDQKKHTGQMLAGASLIAWGLYMVVFAFLKVDRFLNLAHGFLVGFQMLAAFGMVAMVMDRIQFKVTENEKRIRRLEGLLPICSYCKKIRDKDNAWQTLELYIEDHSKAEFSHGICPDCFEKHRPDR